MIATIDPVNYPTICDSISVSIVDSITMQTIATVKDVITTHGYGNFFFTNLVPGRHYYVAIKNRNALETWSKFAYPLDSGVLTIDFTN